MIANPPEHDENYHPEPDENNHLEQSILIFFTELSQVFATRPGLRAFGLSARLIPHVNVLFS